MPQMIRLATDKLAQVAAAGNGPVYLADEDGRIVMVLTDIRPIDDADEPLIVRAESAEPEGLR